MAVTSKLQPSDTCWWERGAAVHRPALPGMGKPVCSVMLMSASALRRGPLEKLQQAIERQLGVHPRGRLAGIVQRFYPQCRACSDRQSAAVRLDQRTLVTHFSGFRPPYAAGAHCACQCSNLENLEHWPVCAICYPAIQLR